MTATRSSATRNGISGAFRLMARSSGDANRRSIPSGEMEERDKHDGVAYAVVLVAISIAVSPVSAPIAALLLRLMLIDCGCTPRCWLVFRTISRSIDEQGIATLRCHATAVHDGKFRN